MNKYIWMCVEADEYELPLAVADTARELGALIGRSGHAVESFVSKKSSGRTNGTKIVKVRNEE